MAIYKRGENWYIDFTFKEQRIRESIGPSKKDAQKVIDKKKTEIVENKYLDIRKDPDPVKFNDFAREYRAWALGNKKPSTCCRELYIMQKFDKEFEGKYLHEITSWQIEKWKAERKKTLKAASVNRELCLLKHMFTMAVKWKMMKENAVRDVKRFKGETKRVRYLMPEEIQVLLSNCDGLLRGYLKPMVTIALHTGMRKGEIQGLTWPQVSFEQGIITLHDTKNGERRDIPMDETAKATFNGIERKGDLIFPSRNGTRIEDAQVQIAFTEAVKRSKIEDFRFHDLRHTFASSLVMAGVELNVVRELLGHKKMDMTLRYAHLSPKHKTRAITILDEFMSQNSPQAKKVVRLRG